MSRSFTPILARVVAFATSLMLSIGAASADPGHFGPAAVDGHTHVAEFAGPLAVVAILFALIGYVRR